MGKLGDMVGDISDAAMSTARTVKRKMRLGNQQKCVVVPMSHPKSTNQRQRVKPFAMRRDDDGEEEGSDGFDLESDTESETASDEFREDPATKMRMNVHGRRIKQ